MLSQESRTFSNAMPEQYRFQFAGKGGEYFSIWIVNLLLSIVTLGIYSAWAKVRREQYFHRNTLLDGQPFDYTASPVKILIGRIIVIAAIGIGSVLQNISVELAIAVTAIFALTYPWIVVRSLKFRARNTRYRNLAFRFSGTTWKAVKVYIWIYVAIAPIVIAGLMLSNQIAQIEAIPEGQDPALITQLFMPLLVSAVVSMILFVLLWPVYQCHIKRFLHTHLHYGDAQGDFDATPGDFYRVMLKTGGYSILALLLTAVIGGISYALGAPWLLVIFMYAVLVIPTAAYTVFLTNTVYTHATVGEQSFESDMEVGSYLKLLLVNMVLLIVTLGLAWAWVKVRLAQYRLEHMSVIAVPGAIERIIADAQRDESALGEEAGEFLDFDVSL